jgi:two-component system NtrC family sensor kinase
MEKEKRGEAAYYRSITRNIIMIILVVSLTPMFLVSGIILYQFQNSYREKIFDHLGELVENHKQNIDSFLTEKLNDIKFLARTFSFEELSD